ncbi:winged helix-turn-helix domain-containing protein [Entomobacter blattae]|uniref:HNH nuclease domain-containing protein n=1 Tax=Entomobacter blattae TaxID=2762277 RepID=A0A7H1NRJ2_9PROT|nr:winged helix-turn-helix domain-containing protein [Entomobacter blattae]QNT78402.1 hypothetical protein JGUZn3_11760 [Entomobacter blattae]
MSLPTQSKIELPLLNLIYRSKGEIKANDCYAPLAEHFNLTFKEQKDPRKNEESHWKNRVRWAKQNLVGYGYLYKKEDSGHGVWKITLLGQNKVEEASESEFIYFDDIDELFYESNKKQSVTNTYERNKEARARFIHYYGCKCLVCDLDFKEKYGEVGENFIHVHHIVPISQISIKNTVDPIKDLRPVCPNCHAMIHKKKIPFSIEEMKKILLEEESKKR